MSNECKSCRSGVWSCLLVALDLLEDVAMTTAAIAAACLDLLANPDENVPGPESA